MLRRFDAEYMARRPQDACEMLAAFNEQFARRAKEMTSALLGEVLYAASCEMKNSFARSDV